MTVDEAIYRLQGAMISGRYDAEALQAVAGYVEQVRDVERLADCVYETPLGKEVANRLAAARLGESRKGRDE